MTDLWDWLLQFGTRLEEWILLFAESLWIYPGIFAVSLLDAIFPVVPSESTVIAASTASHVTGMPILALIFLAAAVGAWCGDQLAYLIGSKIDVRTLRVFQRPRWRRGLDWAEHMLERRGVTFIIAARFIPLGRVLVNLAAGALHYPHRRFMGVDAIAVVIWAGWGVAIGSTAGALLPEDNLVLSIALGVVAGVGLGLLVDKLLVLFGFERPDLPDLVAEIPERELPPRRRHRD